MLNIQMAIYLFILINRQSIHPIDKYVNKEADDFTLEDLEDIILFLGPYYISTKNIPAIFITLSSTFCYFEVRAEVFYHRLRLFFSLSFLL